MAGKKVKRDDGALQSKTAKRSVGKKAAEGFLASGDMDRIIPLCGGEWAYVLDPRDGKTHHIRVGSNKWTTVINDLLASDKFGARIESQLNKLGWEIPTMDAVEV